MKNLISVTLILSFALVLLSICLSAKADTRTLNPNPTLTYEYRLCEADIRIQPAKWDCGSWTKDQHRLVDYITLMSGTVWVFTIEEREVKGKNQ